MTTTRATQNKLLLKHLEDKGSITSIEAFNLYGITRLSGRIYDLRRAGHEIKGNTESGRNRYGDKVHYTRYKLEAPQWQYIGQSQ